MSLIDALLLAIVQGLTEFLPVSSSGHMVLTKSLLHISSPGAVWEVALHLGTLIAVFVVFRKDIAEAVTGFGSGLLRLKKGEGWKAVWNESVGFRMGWFVILGTLPAAIVGLSLKNFIEGLFASPMAALCMLFVTGEILWLTRSHNLYRPDGKLRLSDSLFIGVAQAFALLPGVSRSGITICAGVFRNVDRHTAARFSFLLSIPAILGGGLLEARHVSALPSDEMTTLLIAVATSAVVGYGALKLLLGIVNAGRLHWFAWYCWAVGFAGVLLLWANGRS